MNTFPWVTVMGVVVIVGLAAALFGYIYVSGADQRERDVALSPFEPSEDNRDPPRQISGVVAKESLKSDHVRPTQRVAHEGIPPYGGPHDAAWAACDGVVYSVPIRSENAVHSLGVQFLGIDVRDSRTAAQDFVTDLNVSYPSIFDPPFRTVIVLGRNYPTSVVPTTMVLDRRHRVAAVFLRELLAEDLRPVVEQIAAER